MKPGVSTASPWIERFLYGSRKPAWAVKRSGLPQAYPQAGAQPMWATDKFLHRNRANPQTAHALGCSTFLPRTVHSVIHRFWGWMLPGSDRALLTLIADGVRSYT